MKKYLLSLSFCSLGCLGFAQMQGPNNPSTATEQFAACLSCVGADWQNFSNAELNDATNASVSLAGFPSCFQSNCYTSKTLMVSNFGFTIPTNAIVLGIVVEIKRNASAANAIVDSVVQLMTSAGTFVGNNENSPVQWSTTSAYTAYGSTTDLWGSSWTPPQINSNGFGVALKVANIPPALITANVDHIRVTVYYSTASTSVAENSNADLFKIYPVPATDEFTIETKDDKLNLNSINVFNVLGEMVSTSIKKVNNKTTTINISKEAKGIYFVQLKTEKEIITKRILKE